MSAESCFQHDGQPVARIVRCMDCRNGMVEGRVCIYCRQNIRYEEDLKGCHMALTVAGCLTSIELLRGQPVFSLYEAYDWAISMVLARGDTDEDNRTVVPSKPDWLS